MRFSLILPGGAQLSVPSAASPAVSIASGAYFAWPIGLPMPWQGDGADAPIALTYALAQPLGYVQGAAPGDAATLLLGVTPGVPVELCFAAGASLTVLSCAGACSLEGGSLFARSLPPGRAPAVSLRLPSGLTLDVVVLDAAAGADRLWFGQLAGARRAFLTQPQSATLLEFDGAQDGETTPRVILVADAGPATVPLSILPAPTSLAVAGGAVLRGADDGAFTTYAVPLAPPVVSVSASLVSAGTLPPPVVPGPRGGAASPGLDGSLIGWDAAGVWSLAFSPPGARLPPGAEARLCVNYTGDAARIYANASDSAPYPSLLSDNFYNAPSPSAPDRLWCAPLTRILGGGPALPAELTLRILALRNDSRPLIGLDTWPPLGGPGGVSSLALHAVALEVALAVELVAS